MKLIAGMIAGAIAAWLAAEALGGSAVRREVLVGIAGPLAAAIGTCMLIDRVHRRTPDRLTSLLVTSFAGKMVFYGVYVVVALKVLSVDPIPFVTSFTAAFVVLHLTEALYLRRLAR